jgi:hypothetical protein
MEGDSSRHYDGFTMWSRIDGSLQVDVPRAAYGKTTCSERLLKGWKEEENNAKNHMVECKTWPASAHLDKVVGPHVLLSLFWPDLIVSNAPEALESN